MPNNTIQDKTIKRLTPFFEAIEMSLLPAFADHQIRYGNKENWIVLDHVPRTIHLIVSLIWFENYLKLKSMFQALLEYADDAGVTIRVVDLSPREDVPVDYFDVVQYCRRNGFRHNKYKGYYERKPMAEWMNAAIQEYQTE